MEPASAYASAKYDSPEIAAPLPEVSAALIELADTAQVLSRASTNLIEARTSHASAAERYNTALNNVAKLREQHGV